MIAKSVALRRLVRIINGGTPTPEQDNWNGDVPWATPVDLGRRNGSSLSETERNLTRKGAISGSSIAPEGSVLLSTRAPIGYVAINNVAMAFNQGCKAIVPSVGISAPFLRYALTHAGPQLQSMGQGSTFLELSASALASVEVPCPSVDFQVHAVDFLDRETAQIDELIGKQERLIELLTEKRQAVITHAVTKGLDPNTPTKSSGIPGLGDIPETWRTAELKRALTFITSGSRGWAEFYSDHGTPFVRIGNLTRGNLHLDMSQTQHVEIPPDSEGTRAVVEANDVLFSITAYLGSVAVASEKESGSYVSQHVALTRLDQNQLQSRFLGYFVLSEFGQRQLNEGAYGGTKLQLSLEDIKKIMIPVPLMSEQIEITRHLDGSTTRIDALLKLARESISLLRERRSALISAAVTGKITVTDEGVAA